ncbi:SWIM zinc finger family protein [Exiguobacterium sp. s146]|uniref:SWIM zinc finger family protein n=1 Tax=Exiguobacterium sp. s146 TaxID=2751223 RepID=UPI001BEA9AA4|nr:SWIM zinc finger family protein [Exiguobacterium sp. s146]
MNLYDFKDQISSRIIDRGYDYWLEGRVLIESEHESTYWFMAEGSERYEVSITLTGIDIEDSFCDCPYAKGNCKHEVAAYF